MATKHIAKTTYNAEDVERGLLVLAICSGNGKEASRQLEKQGHDIPQSTLYDWKRDKAQRYGEIRAELAPRVAEQIAAEQEDFVIAAGKVQRKMLKELDGKVGEMDARSLSSGQRDLAVSQGIALQRSGELRGRPTVIHEHRSAESVIEAMRRKGWIAGEAEEIDEKGGAAVPA